MNQSSSLELAQTIGILGMLLMLLAQEFSQEHQLLEDDNWQPVSGGIPQWSPLSLMLYNVFIINWTLGQNTP